MSQNIRVVVQQPSLAKYRVPVFSELANRPGIDLTLRYGDRQGLLNNPPQGLTCTMDHLYRWRIGPLIASWHQPQWSMASRRHCDVLLMTWNTQYLSLVPGLLRAKRAGVGTVVWGHGYSKRERPVKLWLRKKVASLADSVLFYNHRTAERYIRELQFPEERVFVAPNSIDQTPIQQAKSDWESSPERLSRFRTEKGLDPNQTILFVSRLHPDNRLDLLVQAIPALMDEFPRIKAVIVGKGEQERQRLEQLATGLNIRDRMIFTGAIYEENELAPWFLSSSLFCYPANIGLSILHAFGYGLPVITSDNVEGQNPEIEAFRDGQNGLFYQHENIDHLATQIRRILADQDLRQQLSAGAVTTVSDTYNVPTMVDGMEAAIRSAYRRRGS